MIRLSLLLLAALVSSMDAHAARAKDIGHFFGVRSNTLEGPGLVVGLRRTGDSPGNNATTRALATRLQGQGVSLSMDDLSSRNVALVMVRAELGPDFRPGDKVDVTVASAGDATSLEGGVLVWTPMFDQNNALVAIAQGALTVGGFAADAAGSSIRKNSPTTGMIPGGALVERENPNPVDYQALEEAEFVLDRPDFATAERLADAINSSVGEPIAEPHSASTVHMRLPESHKGKFPRFAALVEAIDVEIDAPARVVINERTGTVVMGADVRISAVAIAHGGLTVEIRRLNQIVQPPALSNGQTAAVSNAHLSVEERDGQLVMVEGASIGELVSALNTMGAKPRDLVVILQAIRQAGALQADIVTL